MLKIRGVINALHINGCVGLNITKGSQKYSITCHRGQYTVHDFYLGRGPGHPIIKAYNMSDLKLSLGKYFSISELEEIEATLLAYSLLGMSAEVIASIIKGDICNCPNCGCENYTIKYIFEPWSPNGGPNYITEFMGFPSQKGFYFCISGETFSKLKIHTMICMSCHKPIPDDFVEYFLDHAIIDYLGNGMRYVINSKFKNGSIHFYTNYTEFTLGRYGESAFPYNEINGIFLEKNAIVVKNELYDDRWSSYLISTTDYEYLKLLNTALLEENMDKVHSCADRLDILAEVITKYIWG